MRRDPTVIWFTGLSASGKTTLSLALQRRFSDMGEKVECLDGDVIRKAFPQTGFTKEDRQEHIQRVAYMASRLQAHGVNVIVSLISPYEESRKFARSICGQFKEIYLSTPLAVCEARDPKGLYRKARLGEIKDFTGLDSEYEIPQKADLVLDTSNISEQVAVELIWEKIWNT